MVKEDSSSLATSTLIASELMPTQLSLLVHSGSFLGAPFLGAFPSCALCSSYSPIGSLASLQNSPTQASEPRLLPLQSPDHQAEQQPRLCAMLLLIRHH